MKDAEIQDRLRMAMQTLEHGDVPAALAHLHGLSDTLADPPLAEDLLGKVYTDHGVDMCDLALEEYLPDGIEPQDVYVTIRRRERDG